VKQREKKQQSQTGNIHYSVNPTFLGPDVDTPDLAPLYVNHCEVLLTSNFDIFLDIGMIDPRDMSAMIAEIQKNPEAAPSVRFSVIQRLAMSPITFAQLASKVHAMMQIINERMGDAHEGENPGLAKQG
jgi:hypothetical protein